MASSSDTTNVPICVDLDGTLIYSDLLLESALALLSRNPLYAFAMLLWLCRGRAHLKREIAKRTSLGVPALPFNTQLLDWLNTQRGHRQLVLVTASDAALAQQVAEHLEIFDTVIASDGHTNFSGCRKARALVAAYGEKGFDYAGNATIDLAVWKHARQALVINASKSLADSAAKLTLVSEHQPIRRRNLKVWIKALRLHQWVKNLLLFLPLLAAHRLFELSSVIQALAGFACFGLCASSVYILNDMLDLNADRLHPRKRHRPFASGVLPLQAGFVLAPLLTIASFCGAILVNPRFALILLSYYVLTFAYSLKLKRVVMLDVVVLAALYTVRIVAGTAAIEASPLFWLLAFSMFIFLSLAILKRYAELLTMRLENKASASGRGYAVEDLALLQSLGGASGYLSVLVLALYINSTASDVLYRHPTVLWMVCPLLLYWISRAWMVAHRGVMHDDPVVFAVTDRVSQAVFVLAAIIAFVAI